MPTAIAPDDPECLKLKDSMETGFNPVGTMPTEACTHIHAHTHTNWHRCGRTCAQAHKLKQAKNKLLHTQSYKLRHTVNKKKRTDWYTTFFKVFKLYIYIY